MKARNCCYHSEFYISKIKRVVLNIEINTPYRLSNTHSLPW